MILGLGIDVVETQRMDRHCSDLSFLKKILHPRELAEIDESSESRAQLIASRFAVKEAFGKALGTGMRGMAFSDIQLDHDRFGKPCLQLHGTAEQQLRLLGDVHVHVSLSHDTSTAAAVVIIEGMHA
jgi:holo-[acyl-carrier protein] synthase